MQRVLKIGDWCRLILLLSVLFCAYVMFHLYQLNRIQQLEQRQQQLLDRQTKLLDNQRKLQDHVF